MESVGLQMTLVVKRIKGKLYVYEQFRSGNKVYTKYIAPLEELVRIYQIYRLEGQVNYRITKRDIRRISKHIAEDVVNLLKNCWCGGWDLNPRRPTPSGPQPDTKLGQDTSSAHRVNYTHEAGVEDNSTIQNFLKWCIEKGTSEETCRQYTSYLRKPLDYGNKWSRLAWKLFYKFIGREDLWKEIKTKRSGVDLYVPSDSEVREALAKACESSDSLCWVYKLLVYSGLRLEEVTKVLSESEEDKWIKADGFYKYPLSWKRGSKQAFYCYSIEKPPKINISSKWVSNWASKNNVLNPKYIRKWVASKMIALGISEEVVNFIQGRIPQSVLAKHYLKLSTLADEAYKKYTNFLNTLNTS